MKITKNQNQCWITNKISVGKQNVKVLINILKQSLLPSISQDENKELEDLFINIDKNENLIFDKIVQTKIEHFIAIRFEKDKK